MGLPLPQGVLVEMTDAWQRGAEELTSRDEEIAEYVEALENERDTSELPEARRRDRPRVRALPAPVQLRH